MVYLALAVIWAALVGWIVYRTDPYAPNRSAEMLMIVGVTLIFCGLALLYCLLSC